MLPVFDNNAVFRTVQTFAQLTMHSPSGSISDNNLKANLLQRNKRNLSPLFLSHPILLIEWRQIPLIWSVKIFEFVSIPFVFQVSGIYIISLTWPDSISGWILKHGSIEELYSNNGHLLTPKTFISSTFIIEKSLRSWNCKQTQSWSWIVKPPLSTNFFHWNYFRAKLICWNTL